MTTIPATDVPKTIGPTSSVVMSNLTVSLPGTPVIDDVNLRTFLRNTNASNIDMTLRSPQGTIVTLRTITVCP